MFFCEFEPFPSSFSSGNEEGMALQVDPDYNNQLNDINNNLYSLNVLVFALLLCVSFKVIVSFFKLFIKSL